MLAGICGIAVGVFGLIPVPLYWTGKQKIYDQPMLGGYMEVSYRFWERLGFSYTESATTRCDYVPGDRNSTCIF
jgi:hypothetical protein